MFIVIYLHIFLGSLTIFFHFISTRDEFDDCFFLRILFKSSKTSFQPQWFNVSLEKNYTCFIDVYVCRSTHA